MTEKLFKFDFENFSEQTERWLANAERDLLNNVNQDFEEMGLKPLNRLSSEFMLGYIMGQRVGRKSQPKLDTIKPTTPVYHREVPLQTAPIIRPRTEKPPSTRVYVIKSGDYYKVGTASNPRNRLRELQVANHQDLVLVAEYNMSGQGDLEEKLHRHFSAKRIRGEWFDLTDEDLEELDRISVGKKRKTKKRDRLE